MEKKRVKILTFGRRGVLLPKAPDSIECLFSSIEKYFSVNSSHIQLSYRDSENDECEILDNATYLACLSEFKKKVVLTLSIFNSVPLSRINPPNFLSNKVTLKYLKKNSRKLALFDLQSKNLHWLTFPAGILFTEYSAWVELPSGELFVCGGGHPVSVSDSYLLNLESQTFRRLSDMHHSRNSHAILYKDGFVYVFGGMKNLMFLGDFHNSCERYSLQLNQWEVLQNLPHPLTDLSAVVWNERIFVCGKGSQFIDEVGKDTLRVQVYGDYGTCMAVLNDILHVFRGNLAQGFVIVDGSFKMVWQKELDQKYSWWSHCPPVVFDGSIYFVWWQEPGWICRWDSEKQVIERVQGLCLTIM